MLSLKIWFKLKTTLKLSKKNVLFLQKARNNLFWTKTILIKH